MPGCEPIDPRVRLAIARWPDDAPRGAVSTFCAEHGISCKSFYALRRRAVADGPAAVLEPRSRRPQLSPSQLSEQVKDQALKVRAALESSGLDHGPISVHDKMVAMGFQHVLIDVDGDTITVAELDGVVLIQHTRPAPGTTYVGNGRPPGPQPRNPETSPKS